MLDENNITIATERSVFNWAGVFNGARQSLPLAVGVFSYGLAFGLLTRQAGLSLVEAVLMSLTVFAGSSQLAALGFWITPLPIIPIILTTGVINLRYFLMSAATRPWFKDLAFWKCYLSLFFLADENWALTVGEYSKGRRNAAFLLGSGVGIYLGWVLSTILGRLIGSLIQNPAQWGLDFAFTAAFIALLVGMWRGKQELLPWAVATVVALIAAQWLPGKWYILLGGFAGSITGALRREA